MAMIYIPSLVFFAIAAYVVVGSFSFFAGRSDPAVLVSHLSVVGSSFRLHAHASAPESEYASHEVFIRSATEARNLF